MQQNLVCPPPPLANFLKVNMLPYNQLGSVAAGDINNDGWPDIIVTQNGYLSLYINIAGQRFSQQKIDHLGEDQSNLFNAALADLNNDGWLDIVTSTFKQGLKIHYSDQGNFTVDFERSLPTTTAFYASALAFGDDDRDGDLDIIQGSYSHGVNSISASQSSNYLWLNNSGTDPVFKPIALPGMPG
jgi:hypothetical protein